MVASISYCAFLAGPPLIGFLCESISVPKALSSVAALWALAALAGALKPAKTPTTDA